MEEVQIPQADGASRRAALARPAGGGRRSAVLVIHEIFGLNDDIRRIAERFAREGYVALAPDLYDGTGPRPFCILRTMRALGRRSGPPFDALDAARAWLAADAQVDGSRLGVAGFCMGGGFAVLYAARAPLGAAAVFYGDVPAEAEALRGSCPVVAGYGERDLVFRAAARRLDAHLDALGIEHDVRVYPGVGHSYMNHHTGPSAWLGRVSPMRVGYDEPAAEDSWRRMLSFFGRHLGA